ncbi:MAG: sodium/solute symporter [Armatimonadota bacterium]|nr:sodium/solute symporter [Armatimonadota bacterium]
MLKLTIVVVYVLAMVAIGYVCMRRTRTVSDFFLAGRNLGPWMSAFAYGTTYFSAVLFVGYAGRLGWGFGLHTLWIAAGNVLFGSFLAWRLFAGRTRRMTERLNALTMPEFLGARFNSRFLKFAAALIIFVFLVPYTASVYQGLSLLFESNLGISYPAAVASLALLTGVYLTMGGYLALAWTDFLRGIVELVGVVVMVLFLVHLKGGFLAATAALTQPGTAPALLPPPAGAPAPMFPGWMTLASLVILTSFGPWGLPQMVQKFYSIKSEADIRRAMIVASLFSFFIAFGAYYTGALTHLFYPANVKQMLAAKYQIAPETALDYLMPDFLTSQVPPWVSMVILILVFSASMSSLSSLVLVSSSAIAVDLYAGLKPNADKRTVMTLMRVLCGVFIAVSLYIALNRIDFIVNLMALSWGALAGSFLAPYCYGLFWKRTTRAGAIAGMLSGLGTIFWFVETHRAPGNPAIPIGGALAMLVPVLVVPVVSLLTTPPTASEIDRAFGETPVENQSAQAVAAHT